MATLTMFSDLDGEYARQTDGDIMKDADHEAIKNSIRNILTTSTGTRRMLPEFGANLDELLFEPMDNYTGTKIGHLILDQIFKWEDRIIIDNLDVTGKLDLQQYNISLYYHIKGIGQLGAGTIKFILRQT